MSGSWEVISSVREGKFPGCIISSGGDTTVRSWAYPAVWFSCTLLEGRASCQTCTLLKREESNTI